MTLVVDASVALKWYVAEADSAAAADVGARPGLVAPSLLVAEVANGLWKTERLGRLPAGEADRAISDLPSWFDRLVPPEDLAARALVIARALDHPIYDAFYVALGEREGAPLVTADQRLCKAVASTPWFAISPPLRVFHDPPLDRGMAADRGA